MRKHIALTTVCILSIFLSETNGAILSGYNGSPSSFVFSALDPVSGKTYYQNLKLDYSAFLQNPAAEISLAEDPNYSPLLGRSDILFNVTAFSPLKDDFSNASSFGVLTTSAPHAALADSSWIGIDLLRQTLQIFYSYLTEDSGWIPQGAPGSFDSKEWSRTLLGRVPFDTTGTTSKPLSFYYFNNPNGDPHNGVIRKVGVWTLGSDGWLRFTEGHPLLQNQPPIADAGKDHKVIAGKAATVTGAASFDPDESPSALTYLWTQIEGPTEILPNPQSQTTSFIPKTLSNYRFQLSVSDGRDQGSATVQINSTAFMAKGPQTVRIQGHDNNPISWKYSDVYLKPKDPVILSYSTDGKTFRKIGQSTLQQGSFKWNPKKNLPSGKGTLRVCSKTYCDEAAISLIP